MFNLKLNGQNQGGHRHLEVFIKEKKMKRRMSLYGNTLKFGLSLVNFIDFFSVLGRGC